MVSMYVPHLQSLPQLTGDEDYRVGLEEDTMWPCFFEKLWEVSLS